MKRLLLFVSLICGAGATGADADKIGDKSSNPQPLEDSIVVTANRTPTSLESTAGSVTVISEEEIQNCEAPMVIDLLRTVPGIDIVQGGGPGKTVSLFMRGANSNHTLVLIDGIEMNDPGTASNSFDFAHLSTSNIERIEIIRGPQSVLYGSDALGGVIQIFTKQGNGLPQVTINSEAGRYHSYNEAVTVSGSNGTVRYSGSAARKDTDGFTSVKTGLGEPEADGYANTDVSAKISQELTPFVSYELVGKYIDAEADIDQSFGEPDDPNYVTDSRFMSVGGKIHLNSTHKYLNQTFGVDYSDHRSESMDGYDIYHPDDSSEFNTYGERLKFSWQNDIEIFENYSALVGIETENETFSHESFYGSAWGVSGDTVNDISNRTTGIYLHNIYAPTKSIHLTGGIRFDSHEQFSNETTYRLTAVKNYKQFGLKISGMIGTGFKAPTLFNLYHPSYGNDALEPEKSFGWEIGFEKSFGAFATVSGTYFDTEFDHLIGYDPVTFRNININEANTNGVEFSLLLNPLSDLYTEFSYVYTNAIDESDDSRLLRRPPHKSTINIRYRPLPKTQTYLSVRIVGDRNDLAFVGFSSKRVLLDAYSVVDLAVSYTVSDMLTLKGRVENMFDKEYEEIVGYYSPRRSLYGGVEIRL